MPISIYILRWTIFGFEYILAFENTYTEYCFIGLARKMLFKLDNSAGARTEVKHGCYG